MIRALWIFLIAALLAGAIVWLADAPGYAVAEWRGYRIETTATLALGILLVLGFALYLVLRFFIWVGRGPKAWRRYFARLRNQRGMGALAHGLASAAAGDAVEAGKASAAAGRLVDQGPLPDILALEAAQLSGHETEVHLRAEALTKNPKTALLGWRALHDLAATRGEEAKAFNYAETAFEQSPGAGWAAEALMSAALAETAYDRAAATLDRAERAKAFSAERGRAIRASILTAQGRHALSMGDTGLARNVLRKAMSVAPGFTAAAVTRAQLHFDAGKLKRAEETVLEAWSHGPHPALGETYLKATRSESGDGAEKLRTLTNLNAAHVESRLLTAASSIGTGQFIAAREALKDLLLQGRTARACALMAHLALQERSDRAAADEWFAKGLMAPRDNVWECAHCGHAQVEWSASCSHCGSIGQLSWFTHMPHHQADLIPDGEEATSLVSPEDIVRAHVDGDAVDQEDEAPLSRDREAASTPTPLEADPAPSEADAPLRQPDDPGPSAKAKREESDAW